MVIFIDREKEFTLKHEEGMGNTEIRSQKSEVGNPNFINIVEEFFGLTSDIRPPTSGLTHAVLVCPGFCTHVTFLNGSVIYLSYYI